MKERAKQMLPGRFVRELSSACLLFLVWRGALAALVLLGGAMTKERPDRDSDTYAWQAFPNSYFWDSWARWDSGWYMVIATEGYASGPNAHQKAAFFPLYPFLTRAITVFTGNHWAAGLLISNLSLVGALFFIGRIAAELGFDQHGVRRAQAYTLSFPTSFFLSAYYSEGLFLLLVAFAFYAYFKERYLSAGVAGALACLTRHMGLAVFVACILGYVVKLTRPNARFQASAFWLLLMPLGTLAFMLILYINLGDPMAFVRAHAFWGRSAEAQSPYDAWIQNLRAINWGLPRDMMNTIYLMDALSGFVFFVLPFFLFRRFDPALPIYALLLVLVPMSSGSVKSLMRIECVSFPVFLYLASLGSNRDFDRAFTFSSALFLGLLTLQFANWYWVG